jgi:hypothetical protein
MTRYRIYVSPSSMTADPRTLSSRYVPPTIFSFSIPSSPAAANPGIYKYNLPI